MPHIHELYDFTTSAFILHPTEPKILLLKHKKLNSWLQPGGHIELNEDPLQALTHELKEETGLGPDDYEFIDQPSQPAVYVGIDKALPIPFFFFVHHYNDIHQHIDLSYKLKAKTDKLTDNPDGASDICWFNMEQIDQLLIKKAIFQNTYDLCKWLLTKQ